jgi:hypothetical protein
MVRVMFTGYEHIRTDRASVLVAKALAEDVQAVLGEQTLYEYASQVEGAEVLQGRAPVYVIPFGREQLCVAVRHVMRGGVISRLFKDRFLPPTRVFRELMNSVQLKIGGVLTPDVLAIITYRAGGPLRRADVMTQYVAGVDLATVFADARNDAQRRPILDAVATLLSRLTGAGAQHPDLNLRNVLLTTTDTGYAAALLDVDRVHFHVPGDPLVARANFDRLTRSLRKWRTQPDTRHDALPDEDIAYLALATAVQPA